MKNIIVFFGGRSCEHDVSVVTGVLTLNCLDKNLYNPIPVYISKTGEWFSGNELFDVSFYKNFNPKKVKKVTLLSNQSGLYYKGVLTKKVCNIDGAINCMHGLNGEDGSISGLLNLHNIPLSSPSLFASSLAIDKEFTKIALKGIGVKTLDYFVLDNKSYQLRCDEVINELICKINFPMIIKPANLGSSIGISVATDKIELFESIKKAFIYDDKLIIEPKLSDFIEVNCAVYKTANETVASEIEKPVSANEILTFSDKYCGFKGGTSREFPAKIPTKTANKIKDITKKIYKSFNCLGIIRVDYLLFNNQVYVNEINTVPGSLSYYLFCDTIKDFTKLLTENIELSIKSFKSYQSRKFEYQSTVLNIDGVKGSKTLTRS